MMSEKRNKFPYSHPIAPYSKIYGYNQNFEFTDSMHYIGFGSFLIIGELNFDYIGPVKVVETGTYSRVSNLL